MIKLLKSIAKVNLSEKDTETLAYFMQNYNDFPHFMDIVLKNKIQFLFLKHIIEQRQMEQINNKLGMDYSALLYFNNLLYNEYWDTIENITLGFEQSDIKYCVIKGFSIIDSLYMVNNCIYRKFSDVDILIRKKDVSKANRIIESLGFIQGKVGETGEIIRASRREILYWSLNSHQEHGYTKFSKFAVSPYMRINVDINTTIFEGGKYISPISTEEVLNHCQLKFNSQGRQFYTLDYTYELIQLCYHFYKDTVYEVKKSEKNDFSLYKFCDIREYILKFRNEIDWEKFISVVNHYGLANSIYYILYIVSDFYGDLEVDFILDQLNTSTTIEIPIWDNVFG